jgi:hypothetical protein
MSDNNVKSFCPLAIFAGIFAALIALQRNDASKTIHPENGADHECKNSPVQSNLIPNPIPGPPDSNKANESKRRTPLWEKLAVLVAIGLLIANIFQVRVVKKGNDIAKNAYQSGQRAFIVYEDMIHTMDVITNPMGKDKIVFSIAAKWQNAGNTPAVGAISVIAASEQEEEITEQEFLGSIPEVLAKQPVSAIGPKIPFTSEAIHAEESFADSVDKPRYIWGWVLYRDIFPKTKPHITEFCYRVTTIEKIDIINYSFAKSRACTHHNCIDDFCDDYANLAALSPNN